MVEGGTLGSLKISGSGSSSGGRFQDVKISGSGKIAGSIECESFLSSGSSKVEGNLKANLIKVSGSSYIGGNVFAEEGKISGSTKIGGTLYSKNIKVSGATTVGQNLEFDFMKTSGSTRVGENINGGELSTSGSLSVGGDCQVEKFYSSGSFNIGGLLNADDIAISVRGRCSVKEIGGEKIEVREIIERNDSIIESFVSKFFTIRANGKLNCEVIEGDEIYLENTDAKIVRGNKIIIGKGCRIENVEYKEDFQQYEDSVIKNRVQV